MINKKALDAAIHVYKASYYAAPNVSDAVHCAIEAYVHAMEPAAWIHSFPGCNKLTFVEPKDIEDGETVTPLYELSSKGSGGSE